ncbi:MAG: ABC transporter ATP-binding protein [Hadesarchaea archaeon YNP_N21]|nr:MAG: ABC transporter ATP-binding protein [Hadesarchaea archaeon YNP_N21]
MGRNLAIETSGLTKKYGEFVAVDGLNLSVEEGELFGLLGPNGAGKTTTVLMLLGLTEPTSGSCRVCGFDPFREPLKVKGLCGYLAERVGMYDDLTAEQNLMYIMRLNRVPKDEARVRIRDALKAVGASDYAHVKVRELSKGMRQRVGLAGVLIKKPKVAFLDEPVQGIDPEGQREVLELLKRISKEEGTTILLLSHVLHDVQQICDRIGIMFRGKMVALGSIDELKRGGGEKWIIEVEARGITDELIRDLSGLRGVKNVERSGDFLTIECEKDLRSDILQIFIKSKSSLLSLRTREVSLEEIYASYLGGA